VRNSIVHGIEPPSARVTAGNPQGSLRLSFQEADTGLQGSSSKMTAKVYRPSASRKPH